MSVYGYVRVSTGRQAKDGESLEAQQRKLEAWCVMQDETLAAMFIEEGVSGSMPLADRPEGRRLLEQLQPGDTIVSTKLDRLFRSSLDALQTVKDMQKRKVDVSTLDLGKLTGNGVAKVFMTIAAAFAEFERERIAERATETKQDQRARGRFLGGRTPFGYRIVKDDGKETGGRLEEDEREQKIIRDVRAIRKTGPNGRSLRFIQEAIEQKHGRKLSLATLYKILGHRIGDRVDKERLANAGR